MGKGTGRGQERRGAGFVPHTRRARVVAQGEIIVASTDEHVLAEQLRLALQERRRSGRGKGSLGNEVALSQTEILASELESGNKTWRALTGLPRTVIVHTPEKDRRGSENSRRLGFTPEP